LFALNQNHKRHISIWAWSKFNWGISPRHSSNTRHLNGATRNWHISSTVKSTGISCSLSEEIDSYISTSQGYAGETPEKVRTGHSIRSARRVRLRGRGDHDQDNNSSDALHQLL